jgi:HEAT repeat protein/type 1 glutamine amidotransferase
MQASREIKSADSARGRLRWSLGCWSDRRRSCLASAGLALTIALCLLSGSRCYSQDDALDAAFAALLEYDWGPGREALAPIDAAILRTRDNADMRRTLEERLATVLKGDAPRAAKSYVCRKLGQMGTSDSVLVLSGLLGDGELGHMARGALEVIPGPEADAALRAALTEVEGPLRIGVVNSLGRRGDSPCVPQLISLLEIQDAALARATVAALAAIDSPAAAEAVVALQESAPPELEPALANACLQIAHRHLNADRLDEAAALLRRFESSKIEHVRWAALLGLVDAEPVAAHGRLMKALASDNARIRLAAAELIGEDAGDQLVQQLAESLAELPKTGQLVLLDALKQSRHPAVRTAALGVLAASSPSLRGAAIRALGRSGQPVDVPVLVQYATDADKVVSAAAQAALKALPGSGVNQALLDGLESASAEQQVATVRALVARNAPDLQLVLLGLARSPDESVRIESLSSLESCADADHAEVLVEILANAPPGPVREAAGRAVWRSCLRIKDPTQRAWPILSQLRQDDPARRAALLPALGRLGGERALEVVNRAKKDADKSVRDGAFRALCNWPDATVADDLFQLARQADETSHRIWALRGLARVLGRQGKEKPQEAFEGLRDVMQLATRLEERLLVLSRLTAVRVPGALRLATSLLDDTELKSAAIDVTIDLAEGMKASHPKEARVALENAARATEDPPLQAYIGKLLWNMQLKETAASSGVAEETSTKRIVLIGHGPDHPYRTHCYLPDCELLAKCLRQTPGVEAVVSRGWPEDEKVLEGVDAIVLHVRQGGNLFFHPAHRNRAQGLLDQGVGLVAIHWGTGADVGPIGGRWKKSLGGHFNAEHFGKYAIETSTVRQTDHSHPVSRGWDDFQLRDEFYFKLQFEETAVPLSQATVQGEEYPVSWIFERPQGGRSFAFVGGHFHENFGLKPFRQMTVNGILWTAHVEIPEPGAPVRIRPQDLVLSPEFEAVKEPKP